MNDRREMSLWGFFPVGLSSGSRCALSQTIELSRLWYTPSVWVWRADVCDVSLMKHMESLLLLRF